MTSLVVKFATEWHNYNIYHKISGSLDTTCSCTQLPDLVEGDSQVYSLIILSSIFPLGWLTSYCFYLLDSFLRMRDKTDHEATAMMKAQFMSLWDGKQIVTENLLFTM